MKNLLGLFLLVSVAAFATPSITSLTPSTGAVGSSVTIAGSGFGSPQGISTIKFNGTTATVTGWTATSITATVATGTTTGSVVVTVSNVASNGLTFTVTPAPSITSLTPNTGAVGSSIVIAGANFGPSQGTGKVTFSSGKVATITNWSATSITATVSVGAVTGTVVVTAAGGVASTGVTYTVTSAPSITSLTPNTGAVGSSIVIAGANFGPSQGNGNVKFNGTAATVTAWSATSITATVPTGATTGNVVVTAAGGVASGGVSFTVTGPPSITSLTPNTGAVGSSIVIAGANFGPSQGNGNVKFNGTSATITAWSATSITATVATGTTTGNVVVTAAGGVASSGVTFTITPAPSITSLTPNAGAVSATVVIAGANFGPSQGNGKVTFSSGKVATVTAWSATSITATVPAGAVTGTVVVMAAGGVASAGSTFTVVAAPGITSLAPTSGAVGTSVTITGTNLGGSQGSSTVAFNGTFTTPTSWTATTVKAPVPAGATTGNVVIHASGVDSNGVAFTMAPSISSLSPNSGAVGSSVVIAGLNFGSAQGTVTFSTGKTATITSWSATSIIATVPTGAITGNVMVTTVGGLVSAGVNFTVTAAPSTSSLAPNTGAVGSSIVIAGSNFGTQGTGSTVTFGGSAATITSWNATSITATVPTGAVTGNVVVTAAGGVASTGVTFTVTGVPSITSLTPNAGAVGSSVVIAGSNFGPSQGNGNVKFNGTTATITNWSATSITATLPVGAITGNTVVTAAGGMASAGASFTVKPAPSITSLTPGTGAVGSSVVITGTSFGGSQGNGGVTFNGTTATITSWSTTSITATVPTGATTGNVLVTAAGGVAGSGVSFTVTPGPSIGSLTPTSGVVGSPVVIAGSNFGGSQGNGGVTFNGIAAVVTAWSASSITATVPAGATTGNVVVTAGGGVGSSGVSFTVTTSAYSFRRSITIDHTKVPNTDLSNFPILVSGTYSYLATVANGGKVQSANGYDIIFASDVAGSIKLDHEIESYDPVTGTINFWVRIPVLSHTADTVIYVQYGNSGITASQQNKTEVWDASYQMVLHLGESAAPYQDSTSNGFSSTGGTTPVQTSAKIGQGQSFNGTSQFIAYSQAQSPNPTGSITLETWIKTSETALKGVFGKWASDGLQDSNQSYEIYYGNGVPSAALNAVDGADVLVTNTTTISDGAWHHLAVTAPVTGSISFYTDGALTGSLNNSDPLLAMTADRLLIGATSLAAGPYYMNGALDEVRISNSARSADWVATEYKNQSSPETFYTLGQENSVGISISPTLSSLTAGQTQQFTATVTGSTNTAATWLINPTGVGSINSAGLYAAPTTISAHQTVTVTATSVVDNTKSASALVTLNISTIINSLSSASGIAGSTVTITGSGFGAVQGSGGVTFNGAVAAVTSWNDTSIIVTVPLGATSGNVVVTAGTGVASNSVSFTVVPNISSIAPNSGGIGSVVVITGTTFGATQGSSTVTFNGTAATITNWSATSITAAVSAGATTGSVVVTAGGVSSSGVPFTVTPPPSITSLTPNVGALGSQVTIAGSNFGATQGNGTIAFRGTVASVSSWSNSTITVTVPAGAITGNVVVTAAGGLASGGANFAVAAPPSISSLSSSTGAIGSSVVISGSSFGLSQGNGSVAFNGTTASITSWSGINITATVPAGATTGNVVVTAAGGIASNGLNFTVAPVISSLTPTSGEPGTSLIIAGSNFGPAAGRVTFNGQLAATSNWTATSITAVVPNGAASGNVVVSNGGLPSNGVSYTVLSPGITMLNPASGTAGTSVTISGSNFGAGAGTVTFNGQVAAISNWSDGNIVAVVPGGATAGNVVVSNGGLQSNGVGFSVTGAYQYRRAILIDHTRVPNTDQSNFPMLVSGTYSYLATVANGGKVQNASGYDIIFTSDAASTQLDYEVESYDPVTGTINFWVRAPVLSHTADTLIYIQYGNSNITTSQQNKTGVWDSNYQGVWHLSDLNDSTSNAYNLAGYNGGTAPNSVSGAIGGGMSFASASSQNAGISGPSSPKLQIVGGQTWEMWIKSATLTSALNRGPTMINSSSTVFMGLYSYGGVLSFVTSTAAFSDSSVPPVNNVWLHVAGVYDPDAFKQRIYVNGTKTEVPANPPHTTENNAMTLADASDFTAHQYSDDALDEIRISNTARSGDWVVTEYNNQSAPATFYALGQENAPAITGLSPASGIIGTSVTINGDSFGTSPGTVTFNGQSATISSWSATSIVAVVPPGSNSGPVVVTSSGGVQSNGFTFIFNSIAPTSGPIGSSVVIAGNTFGATQGSSTVTFNGTPATATQWSANSITAVVPAGATSGNVVVTAGGFSTPGVPFTLTPAPSIALLTPNSGTVGSLVTIAGANFGTTQGNGTVTFKGTVASVSSWSNSTITVTVPAGAITGNVVVTVAGGVASGGMNFTLVAGPSISNLSPGTGAIGSSVVVTGSGFGLSQGNGSVAFNGTTANVTNWSASSITATVPAGATTGNVLVTAAGGVASNGVNFTVSGVPSISSLSPNLGAVGSSVVINGSNFEPSQGSGVVIFNGAAATVSSWSATSITAVVPNGATTGNVIVTVAGGIASNGVSFTVAPVIAALSPSTAAAGVSVNITGSNFGATAGGVTFNGLTASVSSWSNASIVAVAPNSVTTGNVVVTSSGGLPSNGVTFTVGPFISSLSPTSGAPGTSVTINGTNFGGSAGTVTFAGVGAVVSNWTNTAITVTVPGISSSGNVVVTSLGVASNGVNFSVPQQVFSGPVSYSYDQLGRLVGVVAASGDAAQYSYDAVGNIISITRISASQPAILSFSPASGPVGTQVTISGSAFSSTAAQDIVAFNGINATITSASATQFVATVPSGATSGTITVTAPSGSATSASSFIVTNASAPTITSFTPQIAVVGSSVTVAGTNFDPAPQNDRLMVNTTAATLPSGVNSTSLSITVPSVGSGHISLSAPGGIASSTDDLFIPPAVTPAFFDPPPGTPASRIVYTGRTTLGNTAIVSIPTPATMGMLLFDGVAGRKVMITNIPSGTFGNKCFIQLYQPNGTGIGIPNFCGATLLRPLPSTGTYTVIVFSGGTSLPGDDTGTVTVGLTDITDVVGTVNTTGTPVTIAVTTPGQNARLNFSVSGVGQQPVVSFANNTMGNVAVSLLDPNGNTVTSTNSSAASFGLPVITLTSSGLYSVLIAPCCNTGSIQVAVTLQGGARPVPARPAGQVLDPSSPLATNLVGLFVMNEGVGSTDANLFGNQTANFAGTATPTWNAADPSILFNGGPRFLGNGQLGPDSYLNAGTGLAFDQLTVSKMTVVAKVFVTIGTLPGGGIAEKNDGNTGGSGFSFGWDVNGALGLVVEAATLNMRVQTAGGLLPSGQWIQVACTWDGTVGNAAAAHLYVNGVEQSKANSADPNGVIGYANATDQPFLIGKSTFSGFNDFDGASLNGKMSYLAVYKGRILTTTEMNQLDAQLPIH